MLENLKGVFTTSLVYFLSSENENIFNGVSERNLCARLACVLENNAHSSGLSELYVADVEYNRKQGGQVKTILNNGVEVVNVTCDLILHSRGKMGEHDNLIAIEMKKAGRPRQEAVSDKQRLRMLTKQSFDDIWSWDGSHPEHVCGYKLGYFIDIDYRNKTCEVTEYISGEKSNRKFFKIPEL